MVAYPVLAGEIAKRGIKKKTIAERIGVCDKSLNNKLNGRVPFTWPEVKTIRHQFFRIWIRMNSLCKLIATVRRKWRSYHAENKTAYRAGA